MATLLLGNFGTNTITKKSKKQGENPFNSLYLIAILIFVGSLFSQFLESPSPRLKSDLAALAIGLVIALIAVAVFKFRRIWFRKRWVGGIEMQTLDALNGYDFEEACAEIFRRDGYRVEVTQRSRDQGADLILTGKGERIVVQAKRQASNVGNWAVQEALGAKGLHVASRAMVVTNSFYTKQAHELAVANAVELMDRHQLAALIAKVGRKQAALSD